MQVFSSLYQYDATNSLVPDVADSMPQMPDPQTYIVALRNNVATNEGGAIFVAPSATGLTINGATLTANTAGSGGVQN